MTLDQTDPGAWASRNTGVIEDRVDLTPEDLRLRVAGRAVIGLDTSVWIRLARRKSSMDADVADFLRQLVGDGKVLCPVSWPLIHELLASSYDRALPVARLMDQLCLGIAFRQDTEIIAVEVARSLEALRGDPQARLGPTDVYTSVMGCFGTQAKLIWPADFPATEAERLATTAEFESRMRSLTLAEVVSMARASLPREESRSAEDLDYERAWRERFAFARGDRAVMRRIEEEYHIKKLVLPALQRLTSGMSLGERIQMLSAIRTLPLNRYGGVSATILNEARLFRTRIEILAVMGFNPSRRGSLNDFFDVEIMAAPLAYAAAFAAHDKWIRYLLTHESAMLSSNGVVFLESVSALRSFIVGAS
jgi:predicted nucleic acid-binding protein